MHHGLAQGPFGFEDLAEEKDVVTSVHPFGGLDVEMSTPKTKAMSLEEHMSRIRVSHGA